MNRDQAQRGEGKAGCIMGLILLLLAALVAYKMIPIKVKAAELRQTIVDEARFAGMRTDKKMRSEIMSRARELDLPLTDKDLTISRRGERIYVQAEYVVPVEFPGYTYQWHIKHTAENPIF